MSESAGTTLREKGKNMKSYRKGSSNQALEVLSDEKVLGLTCLVGLTLRVDRWGIIVNIMITSRWVYDEGHTIACSYVDGKSVLLLYSHNKTTKCGKVAYVESSATATLGGGATYR